MRDSLKLPILSTWGMLVLVLYWGRASEPVVAADVLRQWAITLGFAAVGAYAIYLDVKDGKRLRPLLLSLAVFAVPFLLVALMLLSDAAEGRVGWDMTAFVLVEFFIAWAASSLILVGGLIAVWRCIEQRGPAFQPFARRSPMLSAE